MGIFDLSGLSGVYHYPNMRASCGIKMIPACGLVLVPEGSGSIPYYKISLLRAMSEDLGQIELALYNTNLSVRIDIGFRRFPN